MKPNKYDEVCHLLRNGLLDIGWLCRKVLRVDIPFKDQYAMFAYHRAEQIMESLWKLKEANDMDNETKILAMELTKKSIIRDYFKREFEKLHSECKEIKKKMGEGK